MTRTVAGVVPFTSIDYPGYLAAVIFFQGCPLRCPFCHNPNLQPTQGESLTTWAETIAFLKERTKRLDGVVFSGGEPLMQDELKEMIAKLLNQYEIDLIGVESQSVGPEGAPKEVKKVSLL